ncbi:hypothetical protein ABH937_007059 [Kitasatospora sp. GAS1066B]
MPPQPPAGPGEPPVPVLPGGDFDLRIRVALSLHQADTELILTAFREANWNCVPDADFQDPELDSHWFVDIPLVGGRWMAVTLAKLKVWRLVKPYGVLVDVRGGWVLEPSAMRRKSYYVRRPPRTAKGLDRLLTDLGLRDDTESIDARSRSAAAQEFERRAALHNGPARSAGAVLHGPDGETSGRYLLRDGGTPIARFVAVFVAGIALALFSQPLWSAATLAPFLGLFAFALYLTFGQEGTRRFRLLIAAVGASAATLLSVVAGLLAPSGSLWGRAAPFLAVFAFFGLRFLVRGTGARKLATLAVPLLITLVPPFLQQIGDFSYRSYLWEFGMRTGDVELGGIDQTWPAFRVLAIGLAAYVLTLAIAGYVRWLHTDLGRYVVIPLALLYVLVMATAASQHGTRAAATAWHTAVARQLPRTFHALSATAVCVRPLAGAIASEGAPLPQGAPLLTFDPLAARVALWDPGTGKVTRVAAADVVITTVDGLASRCP